MDFASRLKRMEIQSAATIALKSLEHLSSVPSSRFAAECARLLKARPTAVVLGNAIGRIKRGQKIGKVIEELKSSRAEAAKNASRIARGRVLTHCHSPFVVSALVASRKKGR